MCRVIEMRKRQVLYDKMKGVVEKRYVIKSQLNVDEIINKLTARGYDPTKFDEKPNQQNLFMS